MTREEQEKAIDLLDNLRGMIEDNQGNDYDFALKKGIEALAQEPCEDAVSRKKLLKIYEDRFTELQKLKHLKDNKGAEDRQMGVNYCINILKELPPATPIRPKGYWIYDNFNWRCSECNETPKTMGYVGTADFMTEHFKFCNHCGARMIEPQESEEE